MLAAARASGLTPPADTERERFTSLHLSPDRLGLYSAMVATLGRWPTGRRMTRTPSASFAFFMRRRQVAFKVLVLQILFTGVEALNIVSLIALSIGAVIVVEGGSILPRFGKRACCISILIVVITRELGHPHRLHPHRAVRHRHRHKSCGTWWSPTRSRPTSRWASTPSPTSWCRACSGSPSRWSHHHLLQPLRPVRLRPGVPLVGRPVPSSIFAPAGTPFSFRDILSTVLKSLVFGVIVSVVATFQGFKVETLRSPKSHGPPSRRSARASSCAFLADALITLIYYV